MYNQNNVAGTGFRKRCPCNDNVGGDIGAIWNCRCVYECLYDLLADALDEGHGIPCGAVSPGMGTDCCRRRCNCDYVYRCLYYLLEDAL